MSEEEKYKICPECEGHGGWYAEDCTDIGFGQLAWINCHVCNGRGMVEDPDGKPWEEVVEEMCSL